MDKVFLMALPPPICNNKVTNFRYPSVLAASLAAVLWAAPLPASATALKFTLEAPASLSSITAYFAFDFIDGDLVVNNTVTVSDFDIDGTLIAGPITLKDTGLSNVFLQPFTFGSRISFNLTLTEESVVGSPLPDSFVAFLLSGNDYFSSPLLFDTTDPTGAGTLFAVDIDDAGTRYLSTYAGSGEPVTWTLEPVASVPLPSTALLIGAGLLGGLAARRRVQVAS